MMETSSIESFGVVRSVQGNLIEAVIPYGGIGDLCTIKTRNGTSIPAEIVSFRETSIILSPFISTRSIMNGDIVKCHAKQISLLLPSEPKGLVLDCLGKPLLGESTSSMIHPLYCPPPKSILRNPIKETLNTGIRSVDTMVPIGKGQRIGLFASAGVGKSTLIAQLTRNIDADICVIALIGERGREVGEFLEELKQHGREKSVLIVSTSDEEPSRRMIAAYTAQAIAEKYRMQGKSVLLVMDSLTRFARAVRDIALSAGELPVRQGYPTQVYLRLPQLLERAGNDDIGSITAFYTILTNPDGTEDPLSDEIKSLLDGHIYLNPSLALSGIRPSIDLELSISRISSKLLDKTQLELALKFKRVFSRWKNEKEFILLGGVPDEELKNIIKYEDKLINFLTQKPDESIKVENSWIELKQFLQIFI